jgi:cyanophycinase
MVLGSGVALASLAACEPFPDYEPRNASSTVSPKSSGPANGSLLLTGGGNSNWQFRQAAVALSRAADNGRGRWVYISTASGGDMDRSHAGLYVPPWDRESWIILNALDRKVADSDGFVAALRSATAVHFGGGHAGRLVDVYAGTAAEREFQRVLDRGGLISGSSAGSLIQASYLVRGESAGKVDVAMSPGHERGFGYIKNVAVDVHVVARGYQNDLAKVIAAHPGLLGIGINEDAAVIVRRNTMTVIGYGGVLITDGEVHDGRPWYVIERGTQFDLASWSVLPAAPG